MECTSGTIPVWVLHWSLCCQGYKCIFTTTDKQSSEKINLLKAFGAEVIVCPTNVESPIQVILFSGRRLSNKYPIRSGAINTIIYRIQKHIWINRSGNLGSNRWHSNPYDRRRRNGRYRVRTTDDIWNQKIQISRSGGRYIWCIEKYHETGILDPKEIYPCISRKELEKISS